MQEQQQYQYFGRSGVGSVRRDIFGNPIFSKKIDPNFVSNLYAREIYNNALPSIQNQNIMTVVPLKVENSNNDDKFQEEYYKQ